MKIESEKDLEILCNNISYRGKELEKDNLSISAEHNSLSFVYMDKKYAKARIHIIISPEESSSYLGRFYTYNDDGKGNMAQMIYNIKVLSDKYGITEIRNNFAESPESLHIWKECGWKPDKPFGLTGRINLKDEEALKKMEEYFVQKKVKFLKIDKTTPSANINEEFTKTTRNINKEIS